MMADPVRIVEAAPEPLRVAAHDAIVATAGALRSGRRWLIVETTERRPFTVNDAKKTHHMKWAKLVEEVRGRWHLLALDGHIPSLEQARFTVLPLHRDMRSPQDVAACAIEFKAALDGLVDAGVLPDDSGEYVIGELFLPPLRACGHNGMAVLIEEVA